MKKKATIVIVTICVLVVIIGITLSAFRSSEVYRKKKASIMWDCSVTCMEASTSEKYVINYADSKVISKTGALTIQNRNDFDIVVHLLCEGEPEIVSDKISSGGCYSFLQVAADKEYTVGIHAAVDTKTEIKVFVYDGKDTEPIYEVIDKFQFILFGIGKAPPLGCFSFEIRNLICYNKNGGTPIPLVYLTDSQKWEPFPL